MSWLRPIYLTVLDLLGRGGCIGSLLFCLVLAVVVVVVVAVVQVRMDKELPWERTTTLAARPPWSAVPEGQGAHQGSDQHLSQM